MQRRVWMPAKTDRESLEQHRHPRDNSVAECWAQLRDVQRRNVICIIAPDLAAGLLQADPTAAARAFPRGLSCPREGDPC